MTFVRELVMLLRFAGFRRLFAVRLVSQLSDGVFQVALASSIIFSPERAPDAAAIAGAFAVVLLPFTVLGPFVGTFLDRWSRTWIMVLANAVRVILLVAIAVLTAHDSFGPLYYGLVLLAFSVNRFLLAGLSAGLPRVIPDRLLVMANSVAPTCGSLAYLVGLAAGGGVRALDGDDAVVLLVGAGCYAVSALVALGLPFLGPSLEDVPGDVRRAVGNVYRGLLDAARHLPPLARLSLGVVAATRLPYGVMIVATVLLYRTRFADGGTGLAGVGVAFAASGVGFGVAALVTPALVRRLGTSRYLTVLSLAAAVLQVVPAGLFVPWAVATTALGLGITTQGVKICVDATLQHVVADVYRGRVFALYDVLFNAVLVLATVIAALTLPADGASLLVLGAAGVWYLVLALVVGRRWDVDAAHSPAAPTPAPSS